MRFMPEEKLTMAHSIVSSHKVCHVTVSLIAMFFKCSFASNLNLVSKNQKRSQHNLSWAVNYALLTATLHTFTNRPRSSFKILHRVFILTRDLWGGQKHMYCKLKIGKQNKAFAMGSLKFQIVWRLINLTVFLRFILKPILGFKIKFSGPV